MPEVTPTAKARITGVPANHELDANGNLFVNVAAGGAGGGAVTVADGADTTQGALADAGVVTDASGSLSAKLRGLIIILLRAFAVGTPLRIDPVGTTNQPANVAQVNGVTPLMGAGDTGTGSPRVTISNLRATKVVEQTTITSSTAETTIGAAAGVGVFKDVYGIIVTNTSATVCKVTVKDDTAGTTRAVIEVPATETRGFMLSVESAIPQAVANKPWTATCGTSVASVEITLLSVKN